jgi:1-acyl-sn-glycerol-3-phosphate acyltransferase
LEHVPTQRPVLLVSNHGSHYDGLFLRVIGREVLGAPVVSVAWGGVRHFPFARAALDGRAFPIVLTTETSTAPEMRASVLDQIIAHLRAGRSVAMNPEGDRYDQLAPFQPGAAFAAIEANVPIVPMTLRGVHPLWRDLPWPRRWWGKVSVQFHPALHPVEYASLPRREAVRAMTAEARRRIASALDYPDSLSAN